MSDIPWDLEYFREVSGPAVVIATAATAIGFDRFTAHWISSSRADSYRIDVSTDPGFGSFVADYEDRQVDALAIVVLGLADGVEYFYRVRAVNPDGLSGNSNVVSVTAREVAAPTVLATTFVGIRRIDLSWVDNADDETAYQVERDGVIIAAALAPGTQAYSDTGLTIGTEYDYRVRAINGAHVSPWAALTVSTITPAGIPNAEIWVDATRNATITEVAGAVSAWADAGGNGRSFVQASAGNRPVKTAAIINGLQVIRFDGVDDILGWPFVGIELKNGSSLFVVCNPRFVNNNTGRSLIRLGSNATALQHEPANDGNVPSRSKLEAFVVTNAGLIRATPAAVTTNGGRLMEVIVAPAVPSITLYKNGVVTAGPVGGFVSIASTVGGDGMNMCHDGGGAPGMYDVGEVIFISRTVTATERVDIESYLLNKWGL